MNYHSVKAIYKFEMQRFFRTILQSFVSPVLSASLYFIVFGAAMGSRISQIEGIAYGSFIVPGLIMLTVITQAISNGAFGIYFPKFIGSIYEVLSAPISATEIVVGYVGAAATKAIFTGLVILLTSLLFVDLTIMNPLAMLFFLVMTSIAFALLGFIVGIWAGNFEQLQMVPMLIITPLVFLGGTFYSISMLPPFWQTISLFNPVVYLVSAFRWCFFGPPMCPSWSAYWQSLVLFYCVLPRLCGFLERVGGCAAKKQCLQGFCNLPARRVLCPCGKGSTYGV